MASPIPSPKSPRVTPNTDRHHPRGGRSMNDLARQRLSELLASHGRQLCDDPRRLRALLADHLPGMKREANVLAAAAEQRVAADLLNSSAGVPYEVTAGRLSRRLADELALADDAALWAGEAWAAALGVIPPPTRPTAADRTAKATLPPNPAPPHQQAPAAVHPILAGWSGVSRSRRQAGLATAHPAPGKGGSGL